MGDIVEIMEASFKLAKILRSAKFIYGDDWPKKRDETLQIIDAYKTAQGKETRLSAAIDIAATIEDSRAVILILAAAIDEDGYPEKEKQEVL